MTRNGHMGIFRADGSVLCLVWGDVGVYNCQH